MAIPFPFILAYIAFLASVARLAIYLHWRRLARKSRPEPLFKEPQTARDIYISLLNVEPPPPQAILVSALMARGMETLKRHTQLQQKKYVLSKLWSEGLIGTEVWDSLLIGQKEIELEIKELEDEAKNLEIDFKSMPKILLECCNSFQHQSVYWNISKKIDDFKNENLEIDQPTNMFKSNDRLSLLDSKPAIPAPKIFKKTDKNGGDDETNKSGMDVKQMEKDDDLNLD
ncbi:putative translocation protein sec66 [Melampsora larici-populina 98AG31]|uniref:Putative translocation protein sec66 n=1 Tax=Melampsora larici-populina (strain 98AG31 / pathotype 3-4-7) TaxID=747676 RepID=F4RCT0_MELLP|nr:putative translocation protein sec66 [Melampsora larici-populina 98AG31]EGG09775.1 putative translocation protein sec66 [Melampsora larici-populina 98AG31]